MGSVSPSDLSLYHNHEGRFNGVQSDGETGPVVVKEV